MITLFNSLTRSKEKFAPLKNKEVRIYNCGPTVYDYAHIGNLRAYIFADILRRYFEYKKYRVKQVMNITDVDDKTIKRSKRKYPKLDPKVALLKFTKEYEKYFWEDIKTLDIKKPHIITYATKYIPKMRELILKIIKAGYGYEKDGSIYFDVKKYARDFKYGNLVNIDIKGFKTGARIDVDEYDKDNPQDFALWKKSKAKEPSWDFQIDGKNTPGRPGWHIECSVMGAKTLGLPFDIHTGGVDLKFPHHENEIAQSVTGYRVKRPVRFWLHNEHLLVEGEKMAKSKKNFYILKDLLKKGYSPRAIRYILLAIHYREPLNFTFKGLQAAEGAIKRLDDFVLSLRQSARHPERRDAQRPAVEGSHKLLLEAKKKFDTALNDDLNAPEALAAIFDLVREINKLKLPKKGTSRVLSLIKKFDGVLGLELTNVAQVASPATIDKKIQKLILDREKARKQNNWSKADKIRNELSKLGVELRDTKEGPVVAPR